MRIMLFVVLGTRAACLPEAKGACLGKISKGSPQWEKVASEAARTVPGRENGGNCDIKNLSRCDWVVLKCTQSTNCATRASTTVALERYEAGMLFW